MANDRRERVQDTRVARVVEGDEVKSVESRPAEEGLPPSHVASVIIRDDAGLSLRRLRESRGRVGESEWIEVCRDKLREVFRIHGAGQQSCLPDCSAYGAKP